MGRANAEGGDLSAAIAQLQASADALQSDSLGVAAVPLTGLTSQLPQLIAYLAKKLNRGVSFEITGDEDIAIDKQVMDAIGDPLRQVVVNAIHHGIESRVDPQNCDGKPDDGTVTVEFSLKRGALVIVVTDDGAGVDWDVVRSVAAADGRLEPEALADPERLREIALRTWIHDWIRFGIWRWRKGPFHRRDHCRVAVRASGCSKPNRAQAPK